MRATAVRATEIYLPLFKDPDLLIEASKGVETKELPPIGSRNLADLPKPIQPHFSVFTQAKVIPSLPVIPEEKSYFKFFEKALESIYEIDGETVDQTKLDSFINELENLITGEKIYKLPQGIYGQAQAPCAAYKSLSEAYLLHFRITKAHSDKQNHKHYKKIYQSLNRLFFKPPEYGKVYLRSYFDTANKLKAVTKESCPEEFGNISHIISNNEKLVGPSISILNKIPQKKESPI